MVALLEGLLAVHIVKCEGGKHPLRGVDKTPVRTARFI